MSAYRLTETDKYLIYIKSIKTERTEQTAAFEWSMARLESRDLAEDLAFEETRRKYQYLKFRKVLKSLRKHFKNKVSN